MQLTPQIVRLALNTLSRNATVDKTTGEVPAVWARAPITFACAIFRGAPSADTLIGDWPDFQHASLVVRDNSSTGAVLLVKTLAAAALNAALTWADWSGDTAAHFSFALSTDEMNLKSASLFVSVRVATTTDSIPVGYTRIAVTDDGAGNPGSAPAPDYTSWSKAEADVRFLQPGALGTLEPRLVNPDADGKVLASTAAGVRSWVAIPLAPKWQNKSAAYDALSGDKLLADTSAGAFTITLPAAPTADDSVMIADAQGTFAAHNLTLSRNGQSIDGAAEDLVLDVNNASVELVFAGGAKGWQVIRRS